MNCAENLVSKNIGPVTRLKMTSLRVTSLLYILGKLVNLKLVIFKLFTPKIQDHSAPCAMYFWCDEFENDKISLSYT